MARALIVDDDADVLEVVRRILERRGHEVLTAGTAEAGLAAARGGGFDVVLVDVELPDRSGLVCARELGAAAGAPFVLMTGHADAELEKDALLLGAKALLAKPFDAAALEAALGSFLR